MSGSSFLHLPHPLRGDGALHIERLTFANNAPSAAEFLAALTTSLRSFTSLDVFEMEIYAVRVLNESPLRLKTEMRFNLTGDSAGGVREQRVGVWTLSWVR